MPLNGRAYIYALFTINVISASFGNLSQTAVNVMMTSITAEMGVGVDVGQWLTTAYMLVIGLTVPITTFFDQKLSGRQYVFLALVFFLVGSLLDAIAPSFAVIFIGRMCQAISTGILMPNTQNIVMRHFKPGSRGTAMGISGIAMGFAPNIGPTIGSWFMDSIGWRWFFILLMLLTVASAVCLLALIPKSTPTNQQAHLNPVSFCLSAVGFGSLLLGFSNASSYGLGHPLCWAPVAIGAVLLAVYVRYEKRSSNPLIDLGIFSSDRFEAGFAMQCLHWGSFMGITLVIPLFIENCQGGPASAAGTVLLPAAIVALICNPLGGMLADRFGHVKVMSVSIAVLAAGSLLALGFDETTPIWVMALCQSIRGAGISTTISPLITWSMQGLPGPRISSASSFSTLVRQACASGATALMVFCAERLPQMGFSVLGSFQAAFGFSAALACIEAVLAFTLAFKVERRHQDR